MKFTVKSTELGKLTGKQRDALALVFVQNDGSTSTEHKALAPLISNLFKLGDFNADAGQILTIPCPDSINCDRLVLAGLGKKSNKTDNSEANYLKAITAAAKALKDTNAKDACIYLNNISIEGRDYRWQAQQLTEQLHYQQYRFEQLKSTKSKAFALKKITLSCATKQVANAKAGVEAGAAIALGTSLCRDLGNLPGNVCTPTYLASEAKRLARGQKNIRCKILEEKHMLELGMGSLLSVSAGSDEPAKLIQVEYNGGAKNQKPYVLVGKGITFDTGGISLKPGPGMDEMKYDMCGAASVLGTLQAIIEMALPINVVMLIAASENMPNGKATKPGDIVTSMSGKTIEVLNTDAEGRLVLCDALTYAERFNPATVIDIATLTGACVIALGSHATGMYSNNDALAKDLRQAGVTSGDKVWQMPLWEEYQQQLNSNFADIANIGGREAGSVTAACFLSRFTEKYDWAHLDIAGTAWLSGGNKGATGRPVSLLVQYLANKSLTSKSQTKPSPKSPAKKPQTKKAAK